MKPLITSSPSINLVIREALAMAVNNKTHHKNINPAED